MPMRFNGRFLNMPVISWKIANMTIMGSNASATSFKYMGIPVVNAAATSEVVSTKGTEIAEYEAPLGV